MRSHESSDQLAAGPWIGVEDSALATLPCDQQRATLHEHGDPCSHQANCQGTGGIGAELRVTLAQRKICALTIASAPPLRASGDTPHLKICAPSENVEAVSFYDSGRWRIHQQSRLRPTPPQPSSGYGTPHQIASTGDDRLVG